MKYTREQIEAYQKELKKYVKNKYPHRRINFSIGEEFLEHKFPKELPEEGLLVSSSGSLVYKLSDGSGYGFALGKQFMYFFNKSWEFSVDYWKPATPEQETKFIEMLKKECERRGLFEDTKLENHADGTSLAEPDYMGVWVRFTNIKGYNKNGQIFYKGKFATPRKKELLDKVTQVVNEFGNHIIEKTESGLIIITPKNERLE